MRVCVFDDVAQESCIWFGHGRRPSACQDRKLPVNIRAPTYFLLSRKASMPMAEYFSEQSLASCARRPATYSSVRSSSFDICTIDQN